MRLFVPPTRRARSNCCQGRLRKVQQGWYWPAQECFISFFAHPSSACLKMAATLQRGMGKFWRDYKQFDTFFSRGCSFDFTHCNKAQIAFSILLFFSVAFGNWLDIFLSIETDNGGFCGKQTLVIYSLALFLTTSPLNVNVTVLPLF